MKYLSKTAAVGLLGLAALLMAGPAAGQTGRRSKEDAVKAVRRHVEPKECFIELENSEKGYRPVPGTGCAHWVAHVKEIRGQHACLAGYTYRVTELVGRLLSFTDLKMVQVGDVWARIGGPGKSNHCGIVSGVETGPHGELKLRIKHCSSFRERGVVEDDYDTYFKRGGKFYRPAGRLFSGTWTSDEHGRLELQASGACVSGTATEKDGTVRTIENGKITGRSVAVQWRDGSKTGLGTLILSHQRNQLVCRWKSTTGDGGAETWRLKRKHIAQK